MLTPNTITLAQINTRVGDIAGNLAAIREALSAAPRDHLVVFPELTLTGYPPEDMLLRPAFIAVQTQAFQALVAGSTKTPAFVVGMVEAVENRIFNALALVDNGCVVHLHRKTLLPNYGVFDERRYFAVGQAPIAFDFRGTRMGLLLCEDAWQPHNARLLKAQGAEVVIVSNASPFEPEKQALREKMITESARANAVTMVYVNLVGGQDDLVFDGGSFVVDAKGTITGRLSAFEACVSPATSVAPALSDVEKLYKAACLGVRDYLAKTGFKQVVLGLSGGIDSALVAAILVDALGAANVHGLLLPSEFTSEESNQLAVELAAQLGMKTTTIPISPMVEAAASALIPALNQPQDWKEHLAIGGNIQARLRGLHLMAYSNVTGALLMNTSNKSELAVGYSTLYGDACGAFAPIRDLYKTQVNALAAWRGLPKAIIERPPTAELKPNQRDDDQLPPYAQLDPILQLHIEGRLDAAAIIAKGHDAAIVARVVKMVKQTEYKRRQFPPGPKLSTMHFYKDWRMPIAAGLE